MKHLIRIILVTGILCLLVDATLFAQKSIVIQPSFTYMDCRTMAVPPAPGDTLKILSGRIQSLKFKFLQGTKEKPIVIINSGGPVSIVTANWGALSFENCQFIKVTGTGDKNVVYGFKLQGLECGLSFSEFSTDCEAEFVEILGGNTTFFGIYAKKDFGGNPPVPYPQFHNLLIHNNYIHDVIEGMYIGETKSPGMEFRHVRIYNNIVENTGRESAQLANCVEDIEVHNNLFRNSGINNEPFQNNCLQVGGNTVGKYYNNILLNSRGYGAIILGMGNIEVYKNYIENCTGSFIDDRYTPIPGSSVIVRNNYFRSSKGAEIIKNMNQYNHMYFQNNLYDAAIPFLNNAGGMPPVLVNTGNIFTTVPVMLFNTINGEYKINPDGPVEYMQIGPVNPKKNSKRQIKSGTTGLLSGKLEKEIADINYLVYPNPVIDRLTISPFENGNTVYILDSTGKTVLNSIQGSLSTSGLAEGAYFLLVINLQGEVVYRTKIIKAK